MRDKKSINRTFRMSLEESQNLKAKAKITGTTASNIIRSLLNGYEPKARPDDRFYEVLVQLRSISNNLNQIAKKAHSLGFIDTPYYEKQVEILNQFILHLRKEYLLPKKVE